MDRSGNSKDFEKLYAQVCKLLKPYNGGEVPSKEKFRSTLEKLQELIDGHKNLLAAIGKL